MTDTPRTSYIVACHNAANQRRFSYIGNSRVYTVSRVMQENSNHQFIDLLFAALP